MKAIWVFVIVIPRASICVPLIALALLTPSTGLCDDGDLSLSAAAHYHHVALYNRYPYNLGGVTVGLDWTFSEHGRLTASMAVEGGGSQFNRNAWGGTTGLRISTLIEPNEWIPFLGLGVYGGVLNLGENDFTSHLKPHHDGYLEVRGEFGLSYRPSHLLDIGVSAHLSATVSATGCGFCEYDVFIGYGAGTALIFSFYL